MGQHMLGEQEAQSGELRRGHWAGLCRMVRSLLGFPGALVVKNLPANAGDVRDLGLIPGLG